MSIYQRDPAAPGANVGRRRAPVESGLERAVAVFNASEASRTVAGLNRSLGRPTVSVGASAGSPSAVRVTVAWELCWYQWRVELGEPVGRVSQVANGREVDELDRSARHWNAAAEGDGRLTLGAPVARSRRRARWLRRR
ncbi:MAG: hypothetical protein ACM3N0_05055 [Chloroflexota bacterium]